MTTLRVELSVLALALTCAAHLPTAYAHDRPSAQAQGLDRWRPYLTAAPGILGVQLPGRVLSRSAMYLCGIEAGYHFAIGRFKVQPGFQLEYSPFRQVDNDTSDTTMPSGRPGHWLRFGPQVRIGGGNRRLFGYGVLGVLAGVIREDLLYEPGIRRSSFTSHSVFGAGLQGLVRDRLLLGGEADLDVILDENPLLRMRVILGVMF
jgi:hypothetical protein